MNSTLPEEKMQDLVRNLAVEICKDLDYSEIYDLAQKATIHRLSHGHTLKSMSDEYGERYDYIFLDKGIDPFSL